MRHKIALLGPQRIRPSVREALELIGVTQGPLAIITAGWREREDEVAEFVKYLGMEVVNLQVYQRSEEVFREDLELFIGYRHRQNRIKRIQKLYRKRLDYMMKAALDMLYEKGETSIVQPQQEASISTVRELDIFHLSKIKEEHRRFEDNFTPSERSSVKRHREEIMEIVERSSVIAIAGGHVATLLGRMRLLGIPSLISNKPIIAWSAGAMVLSEKIVIFHDFPPHGEGFPELLESGFSLCRRVIPLPDAKRRLDLYNKIKVSIFAKRFPDSLLLGLEGGAIVVKENENYRPVKRVFQLMGNGSVRVLAKQ